MVVPVKILSPYHFPKASQVVAVPSKPSKIEIPKDNLVMQSPFFNDVASIYSLPSFDKKSFYFTNSLGEIQSVSLKDKKINWKNE